MPHTNSAVAYLPLYGWKWYNWLIFFYSLFSLLSLRFILFSSLSSVPSHWFPLSYKLLILIRHRRSIIADLSSVSPGIVIVDLSGHRHRHRRSESTWASTLRWDQSVCHDCRHRRWDLDRGLPVLVGFGCRCKWIRGFRLAVLVVLLVWVASASGFWLCFLGLSCCVFWVWVAVLVGVALFLMDFVVCCCGGGFVFSFLFCNGLWLPRW